MQETKFRAWDERIKDFIIVGYIDFVNKEIEGLPYNIQEGQDAIIIKGFENLEQFTGLYDKNGKEIYEGDILKNPDYEEVFFVEYHDGVAGYVGWGDDKIAGCYLITGDDIEVIGNIHENPELLEVAK